MNSSYKPSNGIQVYELTIVSILFLAFSDCLVSVLNTRLMGKLDWKVWLTNSVFLSDLSCDNILCVFCVLVWSCCDLKRKKKVSVGNHDNGLVLVFLTMLRYFSQLINHFHSYQSFSPHLHSIWSHILVHWVSQNVMQNIQNNTWLQGMRAQFIGSQNKVYHIHVYGKTPNWNKNELRNA